MRPNEAYREAFGEPLRRRWPRRVAIVGGALLIGVVLAAIYTWDWRRLAPAPYIKHWWEIAGVVVMTYVLALWSVVGVMARAAMTARDERTAFRAALDRRFFAAAIGAVLGPSVLAARSPTTSSAACLGWCSCRWCGGG